MPALYILIGPAGVGKTSLATGISAGNVVSTDAIRIERYGSLTEGNKHNPQVFKTAYSYIHTLLDMGQDVFFDATNIRRLLRADLYQDVKKRHPNVPVVALIVHKPLAQILAQNALRTGNARVPEETIRYMYLHLDIPRLGVDADAVELQCPAFDDYIPEMTLNIDAPHRNPYHVETIAKHRERAIQIASTSPYTNNPALAHAAAYIDLGKPVARTPQDTSTPSGAYAAAHCGGYDMYDCYEKVSALYFLIAHKTTLNPYTWHVAESIFQHVHAHSGFTKRYTATHHLTRDINATSRQLASIDQQASLIDTRLLNDFKRLQATERKTA